MDTLNLTTKLLGITGTNIKINDIVELNTHKEIISRLDYATPSCPSYDGSMGKYDFQKASQFPYLDYVGYKVLTRLKKRHFQCKSCRKMLVSET
ncbi:hypothetical protein [Streptococcus sp. DD10]|uniref:hypothetical protein n=1 Tax=Streptococcus sp. DD10 TaxID=1777878 RepID=UPI001E647594|nr:hypothetical protein [Streptococcus sp. DD10]